MFDQQWLVWSNYHRMWWGPNACGYTSDISKAGRYSLEEAVKQSKMRSSIVERVWGYEFPAEIVTPSPELLAIWSESGNKEKGSTGEEAGKENAG